MGWVFFFGLVLWGGVSCFVSSMGWVMGKIFKKWRESDLLKLNPGEGLKS